MRNIIAAAILTAAIGGCAATSWRATAPWNFPPASEWNSPMEMSWVNAVDAWRRLTAPRGKLYDPIMQNYQPNLEALMEEKP
jgi:hypothetical protein